MVEAANDLVDACEKQTIPERLQALIDDIVEESPHENNEPISQHDAHRFVQSLAGHLKNWVKDQQGHSSAVRFDDDAFALAFNHFLRCPASYKQMRSDDCLVRPSESLFKKLKKDIGVEGGQSFNTAILQPFVRGDNGREEDSAEASAFMVDGAGLGVNWSVDSKWRSGCGSEWGEVACDEATISQGMVTNSKNNVSRGITNDFFELRRVMSNITDSDTIESMDRPATKVNQWWFRATNGRMFCVMSFFNAGSLSGDVILRQLIAVIMACEAVGSRVFLFACDAGGANQGTFKSLRGNEAIPDDMVWLDDEYIRFINPYDPSRWIYLTHCSTHNLKNMRNRVKESKADGSKCFLDVNGNIITWDFVNQIYNDEQLLIDGTGTPTSGLTEKAVYPDRWSTMNAQHAKAPFAPKALFVMLAVIHRELNVSKDEAYRVVDHYKVIKELEVIKNSGMNEKAARMIGYFTTVAKRLWDLFNARCPGNLNLAGKIATFEFFAHTSEIYNLRLLKMDELITWANIKVYKEQAKKNLTYFSDLHLAMIKRRKDKKYSADWRMTGLPGCTFDILRITVSGFFGYAEYLFQLAKTSPSLPESVNRDFAVTPAQSNTSFGESFFSWVRARGLDNACSFLVAVLNTAMIDMLKNSLDHNPMYDDEDVGKVTKDANRLGIRKIVTILKHLRKVVARLIGEYNEKSEPYASPAAAFSPGAVAFAQDEGILPSDDEAEGDEPGDEPPPPARPTSAQMGMIIIERIQEKRKLRNGFASYLLERKSFREMITVTMGQEIWPFFVSVLHDTRELDVSKKFDTACRLIMDKLLGMSLNSVLRNSRGESYEYQLFHFLSSKEFAEICFANLPTDAMKYISAGWVFLGLELSDILQEWLVIEAKGVRMKLDPDLFNASRTLQLGPEELKSETNRFGGWAGKSCMARRSKYLGGDAEKCSKDPQYRLLDLIVCYEKDLSEDYVATKVEFALYLSNYAGEGGLSFVAEPFFDALISIMRVVSTAVTLEDFASNNSGDVWAKGKNLVSLSSNLLSDFSLACKRQVDIAQEADPTFPDINHAVIAKVYTDVVTKICNARFGAVEAAYKLRASLKGDAHLSFRGMLFASVEGSKKKSDTDDVNEKSASPGTITLPFPGDRTAVGKDFLKGKRIVICGCYEEIAEIALIAKAELRSCLESFGAKVGVSLTDSTDYFLAGKGTPPAKIKKAQEKNIRIVNLNRMLRLLRGNLKDFNAMHALHPLDKTSFTDKNYERAVDEAADSAEDAGVEPDADDEEDFATVELDADKVRAKAARVAKIGAKPATYAEALKQTPPKRNHRRRRALAPLTTNAQAGDRGAAATEVRTQTPPQQQQKKKKRRGGGRKKRGAGPSPATSPSNSDKKAKAPRKESKKKKKEKK
ncbi:hypothetical protein THAOC_19955 [Thalassiosira oceanica]|uniref:BRCT domain-containing protein n=1 Tax=Thalassiosira oceanica TaxID=159749 RepID=K0S4M5_THAOC|nr:hypothetical protein THAOC_19955 [Thalassiosira oceanica]|eukprot:EJK59784.1 hypothetical protein THAOC_19955 [Thalassiosira oceanica]